MTIAIEYYSLLTNIGLYVTTDAISNHNTICSSYTSM